MSVVTRFAPSPTGFLHIGGARTALFNWLFARHHGGQFLLRIEDTDRARSTPDAVAAIIDGLTWLDLPWDGDAVSQFARADRHAAVAHQLLAAGHAYRCWASPEELTEMREQARAEGRPMRYDGRWRDRDHSEAPAGVDPVIRLKAPQTGETTITDAVQGSVTVANDQLDDMVLLRADGTPTYMLAVVVDDHDMAVTHVIRGDDHLTNAFRQFQLYKALGWQAPVFAHVPLIHGSDGAKMSKRHGALGVDTYRDDGFLPEAMCNYLLRLGWSHGDDEIIGRDQAVAWFDLGAIGRSPARFDRTKLESVNTHYLRAADDDRLADEVLSRLLATEAAALSPDAPTRLRLGMTGLKERAKTLVDLTNSARFYCCARPIPLDAKARSALQANGTDLLLRDLTNALSTLTDWTVTTVEAQVRGFLATQDNDRVTLRAVAQPLRAAITGSVVSPPIFEVMAVLGRDETLRRLNDVFRTSDRARDTCIDDREIG